jgi:hypothetical protein
MDRNGMTEFIIKTVGGDAAEIRKYLGTQSEDALRGYFQRTLEGQQRKVIEADPETQKARADAAAAQQQAAQALNDYGWLTLCNFNFNGKCLANVQSNRSIVEGWAQDTPLSPAFLKSVLESNPQIKLSWVKHESSAEQQQHKQETDEQTKRTLLDVCRRFNYSFSDANVSVVLQAFPDGVDAYTLEQAISSGQVHLHGADWAEMEEHTKALVNFHNKKYAAMSISQLKANSAQEKADREAIFSRVALEPKRHVGAEPLPPALTAEVIRKADTETIRLWIRRYSRESLNDRLSGVS